MTSHRPPRPRSPTPEEAARTRPTASASTDMKVMCSPDRYTRGRPLPGP
jgi:hypothetical protein